MKLAGMTASIAVERTVRFGVDVNIEIGIDLACPQHHAIEPVDYATGIEGVGVHVGAHFNVRGVTAYRGDRL